MHREYLKKPLIHLQFEEEIDNLVEDEYVHEADVEEEEVPDLDQGEPMEDDDDEGEDIDGNNDIH